MQSLRLRTAELCARSLRLAFSGENGNVIAKTTTRGLSVSAARNGDVDIVTSNGIRIITMNRPSKKNALSTKMYEEMTQSIHQSNSDSDTKIIVIKGTGDFYTAGNDIMSLAEAYQKKTKIFDMGFAIFTRALIDSQKPIIALVNGHAVGIGVTMLPHCEAVYASDTATFNTPFIKLGIPPECCSSYLLPKVMGAAKAGEMLHFSSTINAQEAFTANLVTRVFPAAEFETKAMALVNKMAEYPLQSLVNSKALLRERERDILHKVHIAENEKVDMDVVAKSVMKFMSGKK